LMNPGRIFGGFVRGFQMAKHSSVMKGTMKTIHWVIVGTAIAIFGAMAGSGAFAGTPQRTYYVAPQQQATHCQYDRSPISGEVTGWSCK